MLQNHLGFLANALQKKYGDENLIVLNCKRNAGSFTYDGIEVGAERVVKEIEEHLDELARDGFDITKFSIIGYSLGGLVARYAIGLLHRKGYFEQMKPVNFTTFATPHLGVRTPLTGYLNRVWNALGARTLSESGRQMFLVDNFRETGRPILSVLADPDSIFVHALAEFQYRSLYANIINDRSVNYYTASVSPVDPYADLEKLSLHFVKGYEPIVLDPEHPFDRIPEPPQTPPFYERFTTGAKRLFRRAPRFLLFACLIPIAIAVFLVNSVVQECRSQRRITLHHQDKVDSIPWLMREVQEGLDSAIERVNSIQEQEYLLQGPSNITGATDETSGDIPGTRQPNSRGAEKPETHAGKKAQKPGFPTLALTRAQFAMLKAFNNLEFQKYLVWIHNSNHSHAAIIRRDGRPTMIEGETVIKHWLDHVFVV